MQITHSFAGKKDLLALRGRYRATTQRPSTIGLAARMVVAATAAGGVMYVAFVLGVTRTGFFF